MNELNIHNLRLADFGHNLNKTRQRLLDVILQEGDGPTVIPTLAKKITSELAEVKIPLGFSGAFLRAWPPRLTSRRAGDTSIDLCLRSFFAVFQFGISTSMPSLHLSTSKPTPISSSSVKSVRHLLLERSECFGVTSMVQ